MRIFEGGNFDDIKDIRNFDFTKDGYCSYQGKYYILLIEFFNKHGSKTHRIMRHMSNRAKTDGLDFPQSFDSDAKFFVCTGRGTPYDGSKNYDRCYFNNIEDIIKVIKESLNESLKSKIKFALKEDANARKSTRWNPDTQPNIYQLDIFLRKSGYRLFDVLDNEGSPELFIESMKEGHLHPAIHYNIADKAFYIEVKKYGELPADDVEEIIKGYQTAVSVVRHLEKLDLNKLEYKGEE